MFVHLFAWFLLILIRTCPPTWDGPLFPGG